MNTLSSDSYRTPLVSVIVVNWNGLSYLEACLDSIRHQRYEPIEIVVVDNGSTDGSVDFLRRQSDIILVQNSTNRGFAAANNQGIARAGGSWILLLNADARLEENCLDRLIHRVLEESTLGSASPKIYRADGKTLDSTGVILQKRKFSPADRGEEQLDQGQFDSPECEEIFGPTGAVALYRREALGEVALGFEILDEDFFAYYEDVDLNWRLQLLGWRAVFVPQAIAIHDRKGPHVKPGWLQRQAYANRYFCYIKNEMTEGLRSYIYWALPYELGRYAWLLLRKPHMIGSLFIFLQKLSLMFRKRRWIQSRKKVMAEDLRQFD